MQISLHIVVEAFLHFNAAINTFSRFLAKSIYSISLLASCGLLSQNFHKIDPISDVSVAFSKTFLNMNCWSKLLTCYTINLSQSICGSRNLATLKKNLFATVVNELFTLGLKRFF